MGEINSITASVEGNMPGITILISQMQTLLKQMQDVMEGIKNNPLLKNGISEKPEKVRWTDRCKPRERTYIRLLSKMLPDVVLDEVDSVLRRERGLWISRP